MGPHFTFPHLVFGPLAVCLAFLALGVIARFLGRHLRPARVGPAHETCVEFFPRCHIDIPGTPDAGATRLGGCRNG